MINMELFEQVADPTKNLLPYDGEVYYYGKIVEEAEEKAWFALLMSHIEWRHDEAVMFGKKIITSRKVAWYGEKPFSYTYSKVTKSALPWSPELIALKKLAEDISGETYNSCLLNLYHNGTEGMAYHSDGEKDLKRNGAIASLSFGAARKFNFKHKTTSETISMMLDPGSMLVMKGTTQAHWLHRLPPTKSVTKPRINLTFRTIVDQD